MNHCKNNNNKSKKIFGYEGLYEVSINGDVLSIKSKKILKPIKVKGGYYRICLYKNGGGKMFLLHRVIADHFIDNPENKSCVNHINGIKTDNSLKNLEWVTHSENLIHAYSTGLNGRPKPVEAYDDKGLVIARYPSARAAEREGYSNQNIAHCCNGKRNKHLGLRWRYV